MEQNGTFGTNPKKLEQMEQTWNNFWNIINY